MSFLSKLFNKGPKPIIAHSKTGNLATLRAQRAGPASPGAVQKPDTFYVTASVELGNTTTKSIVMALPQSMTSMSCPGASFQAPVAAASLSLPRVCGVL